MPTLFAGSPKAKRKLEVDKAPDGAPAQPRQPPVRPRKPSCVTAQNIRARAQRVAVQKRLNKRWTR